MTRKLRKWITWYLVVAMAVIGITPRAFAGFSPSEVLTLSPADRAADIRKLQNFLEMKMVRERLKDYGYSPGEIQTRLGELSDAQIHEVALKIDEMKVAADDGLGFLIGVLIIVILVIIIIMLLGHRIVIK
ncbi:MAG TPA: PA2779 family protein [Thermodesulfobacteriota bacterium]|nr:PA2779 family protein [Thermodesulfobacteriota bacterium]